MEITIASRFCGPKNSGNGGYSCGRLAQVLGGEAEVTLRAPPPLENPLQVRVEDGSARLMHGAQLVAEAQRIQLHLEVPPPPTWAEAQAAEPRFAGHRHHDFPHCFTCGTARAASDGLCIHTGPLADRDLVAATWIPHASLAAADGDVPPEILWAATDCAGAWATSSRQKGPSLLGRFAARFDGSVHAGERCIITGWPIGHEGRKHHAGTALFRADGTLVGCGKQTWIEIAR